MTDPGSWLLVEIDCGGEDAEILSAELWARGVAAVEEIDGADGSTVLRTSLGIDAGDAVAELAGSFPGITVRPIEIPRSVADTWRRFVSASHVVDDIWIVPEWCERPQGRAVVIEPFDTFGLGNHPTTVLALRAALRVCDAGSTVLDVGTGSGVLAVGLARLAGSTVDAFDIAPQSRDALAHNALLNGVSGRVEWCETPFAGDAVGRYSLVVANILAPVLRTIAADLQATTRTGGHIVLSGLRDDQVESVIGHYGRCRVESIESIDGWSGVTLCRES